MFGQGSFPFFLSKATIREHATQSGVGMHVRHLEDHLDLRLFDRAKWGVRPTAPGKRYYKWCNPIISSLELVNSDRAESCVPAHRTRHDVGRASDGGHLCVAKTEPLSNQSPTS